MYEFGRLEIKCYICIKIINMAKTSPEIISKIKILYNQGEIISNIAKKLGIGRTTEGVYTRDIKNRHNQKSVTEKNLML